MPPKIQTTAEQILKKAFEMVRHDGYESLTARKLAGELNCSTQPIYQTYTDMNVLKIVLIKKSQEVMMEFIAKNRDTTLPVTLANIIGYVESASAERHLFQLIFTSGGINHGTVAALVPEEVSLKLNMIIYANGIVMMAAYNALDFPWEAVRGLIVKAYEFSRKEKIFTVGFCDPGPLWYCTPIFSMMHPDIELKTNLYEESDDDVSLLLNQTNEVLVSSKKIDHPSIHSESFVEEQLLLSVPNTSPLAECSQISLRAAKLPPIVLFFVAGSFFRKQEPFYKELESKTKLTICSDYFVFKQMVHNTEAATISTRLVQHYRNDGEGRVLIPIVDPEAFIHYHVSYLKKNKIRLDAFLTWTVFCASSLV